MPPIVIYHHNCADGFGAAWSIWKQHPDWEFFGGVHQEDPPSNIKNRVVYLVDFCYKRSVMLDIINKAEKVIILDHHVSAYRDVGDLLDHDKVDGVFDMNRSGAMIAWEWFHNSEAPQLIKHVQDRDLWKFDLSGTRQILEALFSYEYDFATWDKLILDTTIDSLYNDGSVILNKKMKDINKLIDRNMYYGIIGGYNVPVLNAPYFWSSEAGNIMCKGEPFAACYCDNHDGTIFSLRSDKDTGIDVSKVASEYGGGGHENAAGFKVKDARNILRKGQ